MPTTLGKNLHLCFPKIKSQPTNQSFQTPQSKKDHNHSSSTTNTSSILIKNFNSLYDLTSDSISKSLSRSSDDFFSSESDTETTTPDFATVFASQRFFFSSPGSSNSIIESPECPPESDKLVGGGVPIPTYSPDPYMDFRRSMQEMVEARESLDVRADWDYLHELLLCYLSLNPKHTHKFIMGAFADLLVSLVTSIDDGRRESDVSGGCTVSRRLV
ncbi:hypothetical protein HHK36_022707 [Tetracentron sinense]|uniref:Transcription repressor n=1 Tax=Tetracentron sinense TaxID=13715 RepID=A0A834YRK7_TETSI|nr:hypothetical protein HHK36_022707 [Tetracentron sinense]